MAADIKIQVVAFPGTPYRRLKQELEALQRQCAQEGDVLRFVQSRHDFLPELRKRELNQIKANIQQGFVHIAALPTRDFRALKEFDMDCRLIRLNIDGNLQVLTIEAFQLALLAAIEYERRWCAVVKPNSWHHPLWLPPPTFEVASDLAGYWRQCDCYGRGEHIGAAHNILQKVTSRHRESKRGEGIYWVDIRSRRFSVDKGMHGATLEERLGQKRFRFAQEVPTGFHYDVRRLDKKQFSICSATQMHHGCARANVTPWGQVFIKNEVY